VRYLDSYGRGKVLFGTDWPVIDPERAVAEIAQLGIRPESHGVLMRDAALKVFRLPAASYVSAMARTASPPRSPDAPADPRRLVVRADGTVGLRRS
jgi:hypothetical protein